MTLGLDIISTFTSPWTWTIVFVILILLHNYLLKESWMNLPPGPPVVPILGSLPFLRGDPDIRKALTKMATKYGDVFTIYMGMRRVIVLNGYDVIKEAYVRNAHAFAGRPDIFLFKGISEGYGIVSSQGDFWREQRRHSLHILRNFGFGRSVLEQRILEEISFFHKELLKNTDRPFYPKAIIQRSVSNVMASLAFGRRMDFDDPVVIKFIDIMTYNGERIGNSAAVTLFPFLRYLPGDFFGIGQILSGKDKLFGWFQGMIDEHKASANEETEPTDFIGAYLVKIKEEKDNPDTTFTERQLQGIIADLFGAGTETSSTILMWAIIYMCLNQEVQNRVHAEIDNVIGSGAVPTLRLRGQLPYTEACIAEVQRIADIVPLGVPHATTVDVQFKDYHIPQGTMIMANMHSVHWNSDIWPEPDIFKPERFLDAAGKLVKREEFIPFSLGKRLCLGESLARMQLFLYFASMMQHFQFLLSPTHPAPETQGVLSIAYSPKPFHVVMKAR